ncbi:uncharacterized protein EI90DRAFT_3117208 [Cantharellus anzutake]|uniref:uncharacterized protein n=1 Tax=Cantharellus anzutake TaxID=1750568 RepID=UPI0019085E45|nr:uncharacterized protein EI90DRAFT_3117208 [Cantharellus anzutake]KAF8340695.1 hypothetical protein EI90DRAFT_3117208 [Cantharellus anzutake]
MVYYDRCLCGAPLSPAKLTNLEATTATSIFDDCAAEDGEQSIYCSTTCARQDALNSLSARDPATNVSSASIGPSNNFPSSRCPSLSTDSDIDDEEDEEGVCWEWVVTPSSHPHRSPTTATTLAGSAARRNPLYESHYQRVVSRKDELGFWSGDGRRSRTGQLEDASMENLTRMSPQHLQGNSVIVEEDEGFIDDIPSRSEDATPIPQKRVKATSESDRKEFPPNPLSKTASLNEWCAHGFHGGHAVCVEDDYEEEDSTSSESEYVDSGSETDEEGDNFVYDRFLTDSHHLQPVHSRAPTPHPSAAPSPIELSRNVSPAPPLPSIDFFPPMSLDAQLTNNILEVSSSLSSPLSKRTARTNIPTPIDTALANVTRCSSPLAGETQEDESCSESSSDDDDGDGHDVTQTSGSLARLVEALEQLGDPYSPPSSSYEEDPENDEELDKVLFVPPCTPSNTRRHTPSSPLIPTPTQNIPRSVSPHPPSTPLDILSSFPFPPSLSSSSSPSHPLGHPTSQNPSPPSPLSSIPPPQQQSSSPSLIPPHSASPFAPSIIQLQRTQPELLTSMSIGGVLELKPLSPLSPIKVFALPPKPQPATSSPLVTEKRKETIATWSISGSTGRGGYGNFGHVHSQSLHWRWGVSSVSSATGDDAGRRPSMPNTSGHREKEGGGKRMSGAARVLRMVKSSPHLGLGIVGGSGGSKRWSKSKAQ